MPTNPSAAAVRTAEAIQSALFRAGAGVTTISDATMASIIHAEFAEVIRLGEDLKDELALYLAGNRKDPPSEELQAFSEALNKVGEKVAAVNTLLGNGASNKAVKIGAISQRQALVLFAKDHGGVLKANEAKKALVEMGLLTANGNASAAVHTALTRSKQFRKVGRGEYALVGE